MQHRLRNTKMRVYQDSCFIISFSENFCVNIQTKHQNFVRSSWCPGFPLLMIQNNPEWFVRFNFYLKNKRVWKILASTDMHEIKRKVVEFVFGYNNTIDHIYSSTFSPTNIFIEWTVPEKLYWFNQDFYYSQDSYCWDHWPRVVPY